MDDSLRRMRDDWDRRARDDARKYAASFDWETEEDFLASGERDLRRLLEILPVAPSPEWSVLEIGCGPGRWLRAWAGRVAEVHGVDVSGEMIQAARQRLSPFPNCRVHQAQGDGLLDFEADRFDLVFTYTVFQHLPRRVGHGYFPEVHRVLKPGGLFALHVVRPYGALRWIRRLMGIDPPDANTFNFRYYTDSEVNDLAERHGFHVLGQAPWAIGGPLPFYRWHFLRKE